MTEYSEQSRTCTSVERLSNCVDDGQVTTPSGECYIAQHIAQQYLAQLMQAAELCMAVVDLSKDRVVWCSTGWTNQLPDLGRDAVWSAALSKPDNLRSLLNASKKMAEKMADDTAGTVVEVVINIPGAKGQSSDRSMVSIAIHPLAENVQGMIVKAMDAQADNLFSYLQERENMFTTSRTISVSEMATTLAHEIKQPIATIHNLLEGITLRLQRGDVNVEKIQQALDNAMDQSEFTNSVINRIRDFTHSRRPQQQELEVVELVKHSITLVDWLISTNSCQLKLEIDEQQQLVCLGDPVMLQQVLVNLIRNGIEAMHEQDQSDRILTIECKQHRNSARISIQDNGHGLQDKDDTLFTPFITSKRGGMGVGLNICRSFIELHQGRLWLSPNQSQGCTSHIELPMHATG